MAKDTILKILDAGANVVLTTKGIDDLSLKYFVERGCMGVRRCKKEDLVRIAKATGGTVISTLANLEGEESFDAAYLGYAGEVLQTRISDDELVCFPPPIPPAVHILHLGSRIKLINCIDRSSSRTPSSRARRP